MKKGEDINQVIRDAMYFLKLAQQANNIPRREYYLVQARMTLEEEEPKQSDN